MPYAANQGIRIHYEVEGEGKPLVLQHGLAFDQASWHHYGAAELRGDYQLILIDARGHGTSDKPHDPEAYQPDVLAGDAVAVLDDLGIEKAHYWGYSLGAWTGFAIAGGALSRFHSLILGGMSPYQTEAVRQYIGKIGQVVESGLTTFLAGTEKMGGPLPADVKATVLANDIQALVALNKARRIWQGAEDVLPKITVPCLLYAGEADSHHAGTRDCVVHVPNATFVSLSGLNHLQALFRKEMILPHVKRFLRRP